MPMFGLIGYPLTHSFSKKYFTEKFEREKLHDCIYMNYEITHVDQLSQIIIDHPHLVGLNVTIPYKTTVMPLLNELSDEAKDVGAVNTIKVKTISGNKILKGFNTDVYGFEKSLIPLLKPDHRNALIIGTGGASKAVAYVLRRLKINFLLVSRSVKKNLEAPVISFSDLSKELLQDHTIIINTTPSGMYPHIETYPLIPYQAISHNHLVYDLVYNPGETIFLEKAKQQGAVIKNGLEMLHLQAEQSWNIFNCND